MIVLDEKKLSHRALCSILVELGVNIEDYKERIYSEAEVQSKLDDLALSTQHKKNLNYYEDALRQAKYINYDKLFEKEMWRIFIPQDINEKIAVINLNKLSEDALERVSKDIGFRLDDYADNRGNIDYKGLKKDITKIRYFVQVGTYGSSLREGVSPPINSGVAVIFYIYLI